MVGGAQLADYGKDARFTIAIEYLYYLHPNMANYLLESVAYQVVAGIIWKLEFIGFDKVTKVTAKVNVNLDSAPSLMDFTVTCLKTSKIECNN